MFANLFEPTSLMIAQVQSNLLANYPWILLVLTLVPFAVAAFKRSYPSRLWILMLFVPMVLSVFVTLGNQWALIVFILDAVLLAVGFLDFTTLPNARNLEAQRSIPRTVSIGAKTKVSLDIINYGGREVRGIVKDDSFENSIVKPESHTLKLPAKSRLNFSHNLTPNGRGAAKLEKVYVQAVSKFGLWNRYIELECESHLSVYPDMKQLADYALLARKNRLSLIGVRRTRRIGQDNDFERLRDYSRDDNYRHIDWRATARRNRLTVRTFQTDQSQRVIFMLDCGRMMTNERGGKTLLDHALNSILMMAFVALEQGDSVGLLCFSDRVHQYIPPRGGKTHMNRLLQAGYNQFPRLVESRFDQAFLHISNQCKQRSLVVLATNVIDEVNANQVVDYLSNLVGKHLPLGIMLRDRQLFDAADSYDKDRSNVYDAAAAAEVLCWRNQVLQDLRHRGVLTLDLFPEDIAAPLVNQYLEIKAKHML